jgi:lambda family phage portal protein
MNWLDRAIGWIAPETAWRRLCFREVLRNYDAASGKRPNSSWRGVNATAEQTNTAYRDNIRGNARDLERNSDEENAILLAYERNVVGTGPRLQAKVRTASGDPDKQLNAQIEADFLTWCKPRNCDVTGQQSFAELLQKAVRRRRVDGATIFAKVYGAPGMSFLPFALQWKEVDDLDTTYVGRAANGNLIVAGIELNEFCRPVAYYFKKVSPDGFYIGAGTGNSIRVEANRVIVWWDRLRPSQVREMSMLAPSLTRLRDIREYLESVSVGKRVQACFAMFIERQVPTTNLGRQPVTRDDSSNYYGRTVTPGMIYEGQPGDKVTAVTPPNSGSNERDFVNMQQRIAGSGQGLSFEVVSRDVSQANYSSARLNRLEDAATYGMEFQSLDDHVLDEVYQEFIISGYLAGRFAMPNFWQQKERYFSHAFIAPGLPWVDPWKEVKSGTEAVNTNQDAITNICASRGLDFIEVADANAEAEAYAELARKREFEKAGLPYLPKGAPNVGTASTTTDAGDAASA